jgi:GTP-binding protein EngB required for normal cell division
MIKLAFFSWDQKKGPILDFKYPQSFELAPDLANKIYMTHAYDKSYDNQEVIENTLKDKKIISICNKKNVSTLGYEILVAIIDDQEQKNIFKLKTQLLEFGYNLFNQPIEKRKDFFYGEITKFLPKTPSKKVLILGRAGTGKSTIKQIIFEGKSPKKLLYDSLEPTRGITPSIYSWLDLKLGIFDSSGQELVSLFEKYNDEQHLAFESVDIVLYVFDYELWTEHKDIIHKDIKAILKIISELSPTSKLNLIFHKIDLIPKNKKSDLIENVQNEFNKHPVHKIYATSIYPDLIYSLYNTFYELLVSFSIEIAYLKNKLDVILEKYSKTMYFITNKNNSIIIQSMTQDFNTSIINHSHKLIADLTYNFENMSKREEINHLILSGSNNLSIIMNKLALLKNDLKNLICISETLSPNKLIFFTGKLKQTIINNI